MRDDRISFSREQSVEAGHVPALEEKTVADTADLQRYSDFFSSRRHSRLVAAARSGQTPNLELEIS
jgi:hypothetical protein